MEDPEIAVVETEEQRQRRGEGKDPVGKDPDLQPPQQQHQGDRDEDRLHEAEAAGSGPMGFSSHEIEGSGCFW
jgi:hypothetical protein